MKTSATSSLFMFAGYILSSNGFCVSCLWLNKWIPDRSHQELRDRLLLPSLSEYDPLIWEIWRSASTELRLSGLRLAGATSVDGDFPSPKNRSIRWPLKTDAPYRTRTLVRATLFRSIPGIDYLSADLDRINAMVEMDITPIHYPDDSFDVIYCSHVLEHTPEDPFSIRHFVSS